MRLIIYMFKIGSMYVGIRRNENEKKSPNRNKNKRKIMKDNIM